MVQGEFRKGSAIWAMGRRPIWSRVRPIEGCLPVGVTKGHQQSIRACPLFDNGAYPNGTSRKGNRGPYGGPRALRARGAERPRQRPFCGLEEVGYLDSDSVSDSDLEPLVQAEVGSGRGGFRQIGLPFGAGERYLGNRVCTIVVHWPWVCQ